MNHLQYESSPYLLQHKNNPVDWYAWTEDAFKRARKEDKPILLSIGYSACHWCHVMAHESFENDSIAKLMNDNFINIKVDREERPDVDSIYMNFVQLITGNGGWPLTVFLTPDLIPFFGGTYYPPEDKYGRTGFPRLLKSISHAYKNKKDEILSQKGEILKSLQGISAALNNRTEFSKLDFDKAYENISENYDNDFGGFGLAPKFPHPMTLTFLLNYYSFTGNSSALGIVEKSLSKMASGGIYDQIGGGFHRYSVDNNWLVPHFEKMLYDNALLSRLYLNTFRTTKNNFYLQIAEDTLEYVIREMKNSAGGFYSAQDADSEGVEGKYFVWDYDELKRYLSEEEFEFSVEYFGITKEGNFEGKNILTAQKSINECAVKSGINEELVKEKLEIICRKLFQLREKRIKPGLDNKILTSWNALMLNSFCLAFNITGKEKYKSAAIKNGELIWEKCFKDEILYHSYNNGKLKYKGYLDNYAFAAEAFISIYNMDFNEEWLERADTLMKLILKYFYDEKEGDFYFSATDSDDLIVRTKELYDNAIPSGAAVTVNVLLKLGVYLNEKKYIEIANKYILKNRELITRFPLNFSYLLDTALYQFSKPKEIAVVTGDSFIRYEVISKFYKEYYPFTILAVKLDGDETSLELLKGKNLLAEQHTFYVCENFICHSPITTFEEMEALLKNSRFH